jgi:hypothetical protein
MEGGIGLEDRESGFELGQTGKIAATASSAAAIQPNERQCVAASQITRSGYVAQSSQYSQFGDAKAPP